MTKNQDNARLPRLNGDLLFRREGHGFLVFDGKSDAVFQINLVGKKILRYCNGSRSISQIGKLVADAFEVKEQIACGDVKAFFLELTEFNLIEYL